MLPSCYLVVAAISRSRPSDWRSFGMAAAIVAAIAPQLLAAELDNDWKQTVKIPAVEHQGRVAWPESWVTLSAAEGWLTIRRESADAELEWQVVLARVAGAEEPEVSVAESYGGIEINYRGYFLREGAFGRFRCYRERKTASSPKWPMLEFVQDEMSSRAASGTVGSWGSDGWYWLSGSDIPDRPDFWLRLAPEIWYRYAPSSSGGTIGVSTVAGGPLEFEAGSAEAHVEADLIVAKRILPWMIGDGLTGPPVNKQFPKGLPALVGTEWLNADRPLQAEDFKDRVVLVYFWSAGNAASISKLQRLQELHQQFRKQGLVVLGVHPTTKTDQAKETLAAQEISFPIVIDEKEIVRSFGASAKPLFFLFDKTGAPVRGFGMVPPQEEELKRLLQ